MSHSKRAGYPEATMPLHRPLNLALKINKDFNINIQIPEVLQRINEKSILYAKNISPRILVNSSKLQVFYNVNNAII